jgi:hypothetical protein
MQIPQVRQKRRVIEVPRLRQPVQVLRVCQALHELQVQLEAILLGHTEVFLQPLGNLWLWHQFLALLWIRAL